MHKISVVSVPARYQVAILYQHNRGASLTAGAALISWPILKLFVRTCDPKKSLTAGVARVANRITSRNAAVPQLRSAYLSFPVE